MSTLEAEIVEPSNAIAHRDPSLEPPETKQQITPAQAKIDAVAALTMKAYERASQLMLSDGEIAALGADFPDEAFLPGAAGKENLLYIQHACLRDRLNQVLRPGQWSIIPRNRWAEPFKTNAGKEASRVYVEAMLVIRGCFVAEAVGEMEYFPHNAGQNYGDAVEGAKTAALRRCCKELGIGLQAWRKDWCDGWWARKRKGQTVAPKFTKPEPKPVSARLQATGEQKSKMIAEIEAQGADYVQKALSYFINAGCILPTEGLADIGLNWVPTLAKEWRDLGLLIAKSETEPPQKPDWVKLAPNPAAAFNPEEGEQSPFNEPEKPKTAPQQPELKPQRPSKAPQNDDEWWRDVIVPIPHKGQKRADYLKDPDTIGSLFDARHDDEDSRRRLFGMVTHFEPKPWTGNDGKSRPPSKSDFDFRKALDAFADWYERNHEGEEFD